MAKKPSGPLAAREKFDNIKKSYYINETMRSFNASRI